MLERRLTQLPGTCNKLHPKGLVKYILNKRGGGGWVGGWREVGGGSLQVKGCLYANKISV